MPNRGYLSGQGVNLPPQVPKGPAGGEIRRPFTPDSDLAARVRELEKWRAEVEEHAQARHDALISLYYALYYAKNWDWYKTAPDSVMRAFGKVQAAMKDESL